MKKSEKREKSREKEKEVEKDKKKDKEKKEKRKKCKHGDDGADVGKRVQGAFTFHSYAFSFSILQHLLTVVKHCRYCT